MDSQRRVGTGPADEGAARALPGTDPKARARLMPRRATASSSGRREPGAGERPLSSGRAPAAFAPPTPCTPRSSRTGALRALGAFRIGCFGAVPRTLLFQRIRAALAATAFLAAGAALLAVPQAAHAVDKEIWSATLTTGATTTSTTVFGYERHRGDPPTLIGSLSPDSISGLGADRSSRALYNDNASGGTLRFHPGSATPDPLANATYRARLTLHIGMTDSFAGADATRGRLANGLPNGLTWTSSGLTWADAQSIAVRLTLVVPGIDSIAFNSAGPDNTFDTGDAVTATVTFDEAVDVDTSGGTPRLTIKVGSSDKVLDYSSGSGTTALVFTGYTVASGDADNDGLSIEANKLDLNGGTIKATADEHPDAVLADTAVAASASHKVGDSGTSTNAAPVFSPTAATRSVPENTTTVTNVGAAIHAATDTDPGDSLTYSMEGTDAASFTFDAATRQIKTKTGVTYDHEAKDSYSVTIKVSDGTDAATVAVTIGIADVDEPPAAPDAPTVTASTETSTSLDVAWSAPTNTGKPAIEHYDLQYRVGSTGSFTADPQTVTTTSSTIAGLTAGTSYDVQVRAHNDEGDGAWSASGDGRTADAAVTISISAAAETVYEGDDIVLTATLSRALPGDDPVHWPLNVPADMFMALAGTVPTEFTFDSSTTTPMVTATTAIVTVETAENTAEDGDRLVDFMLGAATTTAVVLGTPSTVRVTVLDDDAPPGPPQNLTAVPGVDSVRLEWDPPAYTSGDTIDKYQYRQSPNDGVTWPGGWVDVTATHVGITGLTGGHEYTFQVRAVSSTAGNGTRAQVKGTPFDLSELEVVLSSQSIVEGGSGVTGEVRTTNGATFPGAVTLNVHWGGESLVTTDLELVGLPGDQVTLEANTSSVMFELAPARNDELYSPPMRRKLQILTAGRVLAGTDLTLVDDEPVPVATLFFSATTTVMNTVMEGEEFKVGVQLSQLPHSDFDREPIHVTVTGDTDALDATTVPSLWTGTDIFATNDVINSASSTVMTVDDSDSDGARSVTFTLTRSPQSYYVLGDTSSLTVTVLDNDAPPGAPRNLVAYAGDTKATIAWEAPASHGDTAITKFQYRQGSDVSMEDDMGVMTTTFTWGAWTDVSGGDGHSRSVEVTGLTNDTEYTFEVRAVNTGGEGPESNQAMATPSSTAVAVTWELSLESDTIRQGGADVVATVRIATGPAFDADQSILVTWDDCWIGVNQDINLPDTPCVSGHVRGRGEGDYSTWLVIPAGKRSGTLTLTAPPRNDQFDEYFAQHYDTELVATLDGTEIGRKPLTWADAAPKPELTLEALSGLEVVEGEDIDMKLALSGPISNSHPQVRISVTDDDSVLERPLPGTQVSALVRWFNVKNSVDFTLQSKDSTAVNGARAVTVELSYDDALAPYYYDLVGGPVTVSVLDRDTRAGAPQDFEAEPADGAVVLRWAAPAANGAAVQKYRYRESTDGGTNYGSWTDIPDSDADTTSYRRTGLTNGNAYTYQVQAYNRFGGGAESAAMTATPMGAMWGITLAVVPVMGPADDLTKIVEGGQQLRVTLRSTNDVTFNEDQRFEVFWNDELVDADNLVRGNATTITVSAGQTLGSGLVVWAPNDPEGETVYRPDTAARLSVRHGGAEVAGTALTLVDNDPRPTVTLRLQNPRALENRAVAYFADLSGKISQEVRVTAAVSDDPDGSLVNYDSVDFRFPAGSRTASHEIGIPQDQIVNGARAVTVTLTSSHADSAHYVLGEPTTLTASVVDDDVLPDKPAGLEAEAGPSQVTLTWDAPTGPGGIQRYQYSVQEAGGSFGAWTNVPGGAGARSHVVRNLKIGTEYTFKLRARNRKGIGPESDEVDATPILGRDWLLEVAPGVLTEGGGDVTATVRFDGAVFDTDQVVGLEFGGEPIGGAVAPGSLIGGENAVTYVTIAKGETSGTLFLSPARADDALFSPRQAFALTAVHDGLTVASVPLALVDDESPPVVNLEAAKTTVTEGDNISITAMLTGGTFAEDTEVVFNTADPGNTLSSTPAGVFEFEAGDVSKTLTYATTDNTSLDGPVQVAFTAAPKAGAYVLGQFPSVTVTVLDDDSKPGKPEGFTASGGSGTTSIDLAWDAPTRDLVTRYEYRLQPVDGAPGAWTSIDDSGEGGANRTGFTVTGLTARPYDFWLRAVNGQGSGPEAGPVRAAPVQLSWALEVTGVGTDDAGNPRVVEGGDSLTVTARITNGGPLSDPVTVTLLWEGTQVGGTAYPGSVLEGANGVHAITIQGGATSGQITVRGRQDVLYVGRIAGLLEARYFSTTVGSRTIGYLDDESVPVASIAAAPATLTEGEAATVTVTTTQAALLERTFALDITDDDSALTSAAAGQTAIAVAAGQTTASLSYATEDAAGTPAHGRSVVFALQADDSGSRHYDLDAAASSATVLVLDGDAVPEAPEDLQPSPTGETEITLSWEPPDRIEVDAWQVRHRVTPDDSTTAWDDADWADVTPITGAGGRLKHAVESLTAGVLYDFQVRGRNGVGNGPEADAQGRTVHLEWSFTVTSAAADSAGPVVAEGGASLTVRAEITDGGPLNVPTEVELFWGGTLVGGDDYPGSLLEGTGADDFITIASGQTSAEITVRGRQDDLYASRESAEFEGRFDNTNIDPDTTVSVSYLDDEPLPVASIAAAPATVTEGEATTVTVTTTQAAVLDRALALDITDDEPVLTSVAASVTAITVTGAQTSAQQSYATVDNSTAQTAQRSVVFALAADDSGLAHYAVDAAASSATVLVLDDDAAPEVPGRFRANATGETQMTLSWDGAKVVEVDAWQVRHRVTPADPATAWNDGDWADVTPTDGDDGRLEHLLTGLTVGVTYDFQVRGRNGSGNGDPANAQGSTVMLTWVFTVTPGSRDADGDPQVVEGGASLTVKAEITEGGSSTNERVVNLYWGGTAIAGTDYPGLLLEGAAGAHAITIPANGLSGEITVRGRQDNLYASLEKAEFEGRFFGTKIAADTTVSVSYLDDEPVPVASIAAAQSSVTEGDTASVTVTTTQAALLNREFALDITDEDSVLTTAAAGVTAITVASGQTSASQNYATQDVSGAQTAERAVVFALEADDSGSGHYDLGTPSSATVTVLDDDAAPDAPADLFGVGGNDRITLSWPPPVQAVDSYEYRYRQTGATGWGSWTTIVLDGVQRPRGLVGFTKTGLTAGQSYDFEVLGRNSHGAGGSVGRTFPTIVIEWTLDVAGSTAPRTITEAAGAITARVRITNAAGNSDLPLSSALTIPLTWCAEPLGTNPLVAADGGATQITIEANELNGSVTLRAPADHADGATAVYYPPTACPLTAAFAGAEQSVELTRVDKALRPQVRFGAATARVVEGEDIEVEAFATVPFGPDSLLVKLEVTDEDNVLHDGSPAELEFERFASATSTDYSTTANTTADGARTVTLRLVETGEPIDLYDVATPSTVTVTVLDDDAAPQAPAGLGGAGAHDRVTLSWDPPAIVAVDTWQVRHRVSGDDAPAWADDDWTGASVTTDDGRLEHTVRNLTIGETYDFQVRGVNGNGPGTEAGITESTIVVTWTFSVSPSSGPSDARTARIVEGASPIRATVRITNGARFPIDVAIPITWCDKPLGEGAVTGEDGALWITIEQGELSGSMRMYAPADPDDASVYDPPQTCPLIARFAGETQQVTLTRTDATRTPVATIRSQQARRVEGGWLQLSVTLSPPVRGVETDIRLVAEDPDGTLATPLVDSVLRVPAGAGEVSYPVRLADDADPNPARTVVLRIETNEDVPHYTVGTPSSATWTVLDNDAVPAAPSGLVAALAAHRPAQDRVALSWDPPAQIAVDTYQVRYRVSGDNAPAWDDVAWACIKFCSPLSHYGAADGKIEAEIAGLTKGTAYDFQVRGVNGIGAGAPADVTFSPPPLTVPGSKETAPENDSTPLTASFGGVPRQHNGTTPFTFRLSFSAEPDVSAAVLRRAFTFAGLNGAVTNARRAAPPSSRGWEITVTPTDFADLTVRLPATSDCDASGAICTADGRALSNSSSATVRLMPGLSVADTEVTEAPGAKANFVVTLDRSPSATVTVGYETVDGTALAGYDYQKASGTLRFSPGQTRKTVSVTVLDDAHDDDGETFELRLLFYPTGAWLKDAEATATIRNADPLPKAWLARFGRTSSMHVVEAIGGRLGAVERDTPRTHFTLGGRRVGGLFGGGIAAAFGPGSPDNANPALQDESPWARMDRLKTESLAGGGLAGGGLADGTLAGGTLAGGSLAGGTLAGGGRVGSAGDNLAGDNLAGGSLQGRGSGGDRLAGRNPADGGTTGGQAARSALMNSLGLPTGDLRDVLMGSSFFYSRPLDEDGRPGGPDWLGQWSAWGETAATRFSGADGSLSLKGDVATAILGADSRWGRWLGGVTLSHSLGVGEYTQPGAGGGALTSTLTSVNPYAHYRLSERASVWGVLGYGVGELTLTPERTGEVIRTDLASTLAAFGGRGVLSGNSGGFELAVVSDALLANAVSAAVENLSGAAGAANRVRLMLEGTGALRLGADAVLKPTLEAGVRYDGGDAETGAGLELGGGLMLSAGRFTAQVNARGLLAHEDTDYEEWGLSGSIAYQPRPDGLGLTVNVGSSWGAAQSGVSALWSRQDASGIARGGQPMAEAPRRLQAEFGYALDGAKGRAVWTPYLGAQTGQNGAGTLRMGVKLASGTNVEAGLEIGRGGRLANPGSGIRGAGGMHRASGMQRAGDPADAAVQLQWAIRW